MLAPVRGWTSKSGSWLACCLGSEITFASFGENRQSGVECELQKTGQEESAHRRSDRAHPRRIGQATLPAGPSNRDFVVRFLNMANPRLELAIRTKRRMIALLHEQKQAIIQRFVTRGLDPSVTLKPSGIPWLGDIPQHWEVRPLKAVCEIQSGITLGKDYAGHALVE